ncbi:MAG: hypothetical protein WBL45_12305 [Solirubrobacterales bacterium]
MIGRRAVVGLSMLSALFFCAFTAQSASATERITSNNTTTYTCVNDGSKTGDFKDAHCDQTGTPGKEEYKHVVMPLDTTTSVDATNEKVTNSTKDKEPAILKSTIGLGKVTIECAVVKGNTAKSTQHNVEPSKGQHRFTGFAEAEWSSCNVKEMAKCIVSEPIIAQANFYGVEGMLGPKGEKNAMGVEYVGAGAEELFATLQFKNKGAEACSLHEKNFPVKGSVIGTAGPGTESGQENKEAGATIAITPNNNMQTLSLGPNPATFSVIAVPTMAGTTTPISITTST